MATLVLWNTEHFRDDRDGERKSVVADEIRTIRNFEAIEEGVANGRDAFAHPVDHGWGECLLNQFPQAPVIGLVEIQHVATEGTQRRRQPS